jgi:hypothetical protein
MFGDVGVEMYYPESWCKLHSTKASTNFRVPNNFPYISFLHFSSAMFWMGTMYFQGDQRTQIPENKDKSLLLLEAACQASHPGAIIYLGKKMLNGEVVDKMNGADHVIEKAVQLLERLIQYGAEGEVRLVFEYATFRIYE